MWRRGLLPIALLGPALLIGADSVESVRGEIVAAYQRSLDA